MKISCDLKDFLSILEEYRSKGAEMVALEIDNESEGLKVVPIPNLDIDPKTIGKIVEE